MKMGLKETKCEGMDWINLAQDKKPGASAYDSGNETAGAIYCGIFFMRIKPTSAYENMRIYYTISVVGPLNVFSTYCAHLQGDVFRRIHYK
jgi:hypothetical protein